MWVCERESWGVCWVYLVLDFGGGLGGFIGFFLIFKDFIDEEIGWVWVVVEIWSEE